jgi:hypothetical protein
MWPAIMAILQMAQKSQDANNQSVGSIESPKLGSGFQMAKPSGLGQGSSIDLGSVAGMVGSAGGGYSGEKPDMGAGIEATGQGGTSGFVNSPAPVKKGRWLSSLYGR